MICPKCTREMVPAPASTARPYVQRFKCEWCRYSWEGVVNKVLYSPLRSKEGFGYGVGFPDL